MTIFKADPNLLPESLKFCGHTNKWIPLAFNLSRCSACGSVADKKAYLDFQKKILYDASYPEKRSHFDPYVGECKVDTLKSWLQKLDLDVKGMRVCEVGFGAGYTLKALMKLGGHVTGIEVVKENLEFAASLGIPKENLVNFNDLDRVNPNQFDLWIFQDSFEHLLNPKDFLFWLSKNSKPSCKILIVAPQADSISFKILGPLWPHLIEDHVFHWSKQGIVKFFSSFGFFESASFNPKKVVSLSTLMNHLGHFSKFSPTLMTRIQKFLPQYSVKFNIGEMGILFSRKKS